MNNLLWYLLGYLDGRDQGPSRGCCCVVVLVVVVGFIATGLLMWAHLNS